MCAGERRAKMRAVSTRYLAGLVSLVVVACGFDPPAAAIGDGAPPQGPVVGFASPTSDASEAMPAVSIPVILAPAQDAPISVTYAVIGGTATPADYTLTDGTLMFAPGQTEQWIMLALAADMLEEEAETIELALSSAVGAELGPQVHVVTIANDRLPHVQFASQPVDIAEGATGMVELELDKPSPTEVTVQVRVTGGSASASDYTFVNDLTVTFPAGSTSQSVPLSAHDDSLDEDPETVGLQLVNPSAGVHLGVSFTQDITLVDGDEPPVVAFAVATSSSGESGNFGFIVRLSAASGRTVRVPYMVVASSSAATRGTDYTIEASPITFEPGDVEETIVIGIASDNLDEPDETIDVELMAPTDGSATLGALARRTHTIVDNDELTLQFVQSQGTGNELDVDRDYPITVTLGASSAQAVSVNLVVDASATTASGSDYAIAPTTLTFAPGETSKQFIFTIRGDNLDEDTEAVVIELANPTGGATLGTPSRRTIFIADDDG